MEAICSDFKLQGLHISDPIQNPKHLKTNLSLTIWNPDISKFQIPTVVEAPWLLKMSVSGYYKFEGKK